MTNTATVAQAATKVKVIPHSPSDYSLRSSIRQAYDAHQIPVTHLRLLNAIKRTLGSSDSGEIRMRDVLSAGGFHQNSGRNILNHLQVFGIIKCEPIMADMKVTILKDPATLRAATDTMGGVVQTENATEDSKDEVPTTESHVETDVAQETQGGIISESFQPDPSTFKTDSVPAPEAVKEESKTAPVNDQSLTPLENLRHELEWLIGPDGLDLRGDERKNYFFRLTGKRDIKQITTDGLNFVIKDAKAELDKRDGI